MFRKVLIANRGEIARRVLRSCRRLGVATVAVHSDVDAHALHAREADERVAIGAAPVTESYLRGDAIIAAALHTGADAIHPGYGLLAENPAFARAVGDAGLTWIGPSPETIALMGDKLAARSLATSAGVPVLPASGAVDPDDPEGLAAAAESVGYPVLVKLSAGGGGIGMTRVDLPAKLAKAVQKAARRGQSAFGDPTAYLERAVDRPRHVEVQILADHHGTTLHLFERDCSVQRRHQKVIEEAPAPGLDPTTRDRMTAAAVALARAAGYRNAGTVEFLLGPDGTFWFLEMNTRIQVEHPVTEAITGIDLVEWQLRVAAGERLTLAQGDVAISGHAIELRLYAEDPVRFLPQPGTITGWTAPTGPGVRVDHAIEVDQQITPYYDPMLAKIVVSGADRAQAVSRARGAIADLRLEGVVHNGPLHAEVLGSEAFAMGRVHTGLIDEIRAAAGS